MTTEIKPSPRSLAADIADKAEAFLTTGPAPKPQPTPKPAPDKPTVDVEPDIDVVIDGKKLETPAEIKSPEAQKNWRSYKQLVKTKLESYDKELGELKKKVEAVNGFDPEISRKENEALKKERDELNERLGRLDFEQTKEFQTHFVKRKEAAIERAKSIVGDKLSGKIESILLMKNESERNEQLLVLNDELNPVQLSKLTRLDEEIQSINVEMDNTGKDWRNQSKLRDEAYSNRNKQQKEQLDKTFDSTLAAMRESLDVLKPREKDAEYNTKLEAHLGAARELYNGQGDPAIRAKASMHAVMSPFLLEQVKAQHEELTKAKDLIAKLQGNQPNTGNAKGDVKDPVVDTGKSMSLAERIAAQAQRDGLVK